MNTSVTDAPNSTNVAVVRRFIDEILNRGRFELLPELIHPHYRYHGPDGAQLVGGDALAALLGAFRAGFSDLHAHVTSAVEDGAVVAMTLQLTGTHDGDFDGLPPTGAELTLPIAIFTTVVDGKILEDREYYDTATMLGQLGIVAHDDLDPIGDDRVRA